MIQSAFLQGFPAATVVIREGQRENLMSSDVANYLERPQGHITLRAVMHIQAKALAEAVAILDALRSLVELFAKMVRWIWGDLGWARVECAWSRSRFGDE